MVAGVQGIARTNTHYNWMSPSDIWRDNDLVVDTIRQTLRLSRLRSPSGMPIRSNESDISLSRPAISFLNRFIAKVLSEANLDQLTPGGLIEMLQATHDETKLHASAHADIAKSALEQLNKRLNATTDQRGWKHWLHRQSQASA